MFNNYRREIDNLKDTIKALRERLENVERAVAPFRVGDLGMNMHMYWHPGWQDPRPTVTHETAITMLMDHSGLCFEKIPGTPERIVLQKKPKRLG